MAREQKRGATAAGTSANMSIDNVQATAAATDMMKTYALFSDIHDGGSDGDGALYTRYLATDSNSAFSQGICPPFLKELPFWPDSVDVNINSLIKQPHYESFPTYLDSGAMHHCFIERSQFISYKKSQSNKGSTVVKGGTFDMPGVGVVKMTVQTSNGQQHCLMLRANHTPSFEFNLISLPQLDCLSYKGVWGNG
jgi:hypothetical protein